VSATCHDMERCHHRHGQAYLSVAPPRGPHELANANASIGSLAKPHAMRKSRMSNYVVSRMGTKIHGFRRTSGSRQKVKRFGLDKRQQLQANPVTQIFVRTFYNCDQAFSIESSPVLKKCVNNIAS
jgi:hypothetical protein